MRVLFLNPAGSLGGAERSLLDLAASLRAYSASSVLGLVVGGEGPLGPEAERLGMHVIHLPFGNRLSLVGDSALATGDSRAALAFARRSAGAAFEIASYARRLRSAIRTFDPTVVHSNGIKMHMLAAAVRSHAPLVWHIRDFIGERTLVSHAMRACARRANAAIAISRAVADDARRVLPRMDLSVVHNAIDTDLFRPEGDVANLDLLARLDPAAPGTMRVGLVATYAHWKGHEVFLKAARLLMRDPRLPPVRFYIVGGPIYATMASQYSEDELRALTRELNIESVVGFVPFQKRIESIYRALDVVVHASSRPEPFGRTIVEAMSTGKPVIVAREGGAAELFVEDEDALGVPARDPFALANAIRELVADEPRRRRLGAMARLSALKRFSRGRLALDVVSVYERCAARS
jgi:glycosyltransferase involved in cell wall biosynthesis